MPSSAASLVAAPAVTTPKRWLGPLLGLSLAVAALMTVYYWCIIENLEVFTDVQSHVLLLEQYCANNVPLPANMGFYLTVYLLAGLNCNQELLQQVAVPVMGLSWGATVYASGRAGLTALNPILGTTRLWPALAAAVISCLVFPLPLSDNLYQYYYLGLLVPNVYHNSTWLTSLPFAVVAFGLAVRQLRSATPNQRQNLLMACALVVSAIYKPSFAFGFVPAYGLLLLGQTRLRFRELVARAWPLIPVVLCIYLQSVYIKLYPESSGGSTFAMAFPAGWAYFVPDLTEQQVWLLFASSFALPVLTYVLKPGWLRRPSHQLAGLALLLAFAQFMLVYEEGFRASHGNFTWQVVCAMHLLYWVILHDALADSWGVTRTARLRHLALLLALGACLVSGGLYLYRITELHSYY